VGVQEGDRVGAGSLLSAQDEDDLLLSVQAAEAQLAQAQAQAQQARRDNDRAQSLLCGSIYAPDPFGNYADPIGNLPVGCGLTGNWFLWGPTASPTLSRAPLTQHRGQMAGLGGAVSARALASDGGSGVYFAGSANGVAFNWFPNAQDFQFSGDNGADAGWCGSTISSFETSEPNPCFE